MLSIFLGAGFSAVASVPLASQLFNVVPEVDGVTRQRLTARVLDRWQRWHAANDGAPEEYLAYLQEDGGKAWLDAQWYVALVIALAVGRVEQVGMKLKIIRHNLDRTTAVDSHEEFWTTIFRRTQNVAVITTNYDILAERGIRHRPRPRVDRPGFNYGYGPEKLAGGGYPSYAHIQQITVSGSVPVLKLHGSVSWAFRDGRLVRYHDCRPAIRGDAAIVAPVTAKMLPEYLEPVWKMARKALNLSPKWIVVGYSLPEYDDLVRQLLVETAPSDLVLHVFDPDSRVADRFRSLLPGRSIFPHRGLPEGLKELAGIL